jgi:hypothetical protein
MSGHKYYYEASVKTVMVPVIVRYHDATNTVYSFTRPSIDDVERALNVAEKMNVCLVAKELTVALESK